MRQTGMLRVGRQTDRKADRQTDQSVMADNPRGRQGQGSTQKQEKQPERQIDRQTRQDRETIRQTKHTDRIVISIFVARPAQPKLLFV